MMKVVVVGGRGLIAEKREYKEEEEEEEGEEVKYLKPTTLCSG